MGNAQANSEGQMSAGDHESSRKLDANEIQLLRKTFKGLALSNHGNKVDKETFLKCFVLPGLLGERMFEVLDSDGSGMLDFNEFVHGLGIVFRGSRKEKIRFLFELYDVNESGKISRQDLLTMMNQFPDPMLGLVQANTGTMIHPVPKLPSRNEPASPRKPSLDLNLFSSTNVLDDIEALVDQAFRGTDGSIAFDQFYTWCEDTPYIANFWRSIFPNDEAKSPSPNNRRVSSPSASAVHCGGAAPPGKRSSQMLDQAYYTDACFLQTNLKDTKEMLARARRISSYGQQNECVPSPPRERAPGRSEFMSAIHVSPLPSPVGPDSPSRPRSFSVTARSPTRRVPELLSISPNTDTLSGELLKRGSRLRQMMTRYYILQGNFLYCYNRKDDLLPSGVTFMCGCYVEPAAKPISHEKNVNLYGIDIIYEDKSSEASTAESVSPTARSIIENANIWRTKKRTLYVKSEEEQQRWTSALRLATDKASIEEYYTLGKELGRGRFSKVFEGRHKLSDETHAVKILDKATLSSDEKKLIRTEIAILRLVSHPHIIRLHDVYEDKQCMFIVTELVSGGELFKRVLGKTHFSEEETRTVMRPLLESVAYIHRLGIVHRDLKPENILCGDSLEDIKIADFGLSKLVYPDELLKMPCGTLSYVAPEVLQLVGYGKETDVWSVGVIMYLLLRGELPFHGKTKNEIVQKTLHAELNLEADDHSVWSVVSDEAKALLKGLLTKDPKKRLTAQDGLKQPWFMPMAQ